MGYFGKPRLQSNLAMVGAIPTGTQEPHEPIGGASLYRRTLLRLGGWLSCWQTDELLFIFAGQTGGTVWAEQMDGGKSGREPGKARPDPPFA